MRVEKKDNNVHVDIERGHTHTMFFSDTEESKKPFTMVMIKYSDFPQGYQGIEISTFDDGEIYIGIPKHLKIINKIERASRGEKMWEYPICPICSARLEAYSCGCLVCPMDDCDYDYIVPTCGVDR